MMDEYYDETPDYEVERMREDFEFIWKRNIVCTELIRQENPQAGDYFREDENPKDIRRKIWLNIQGVTFTNFKRMEAGLITPESTLHVYAKHDENIDNLDIIKIGTFLYRVEGFNKSIYDGQFIFFEFDMKRISEEL